MKEHGCEPYQYPSLASHQHARAPMPIHGFPSLIILKEISWSCSKSQLTANKTTRPPDAVKWAWAITALRDLSSFGDIRCMVEVRRDSIMRVVAGFATTSQVTDLNLHA